MIDVLIIEPPFKKNWSSFEIRDWFDVYRMLGWHCGNKTTAEKWANSKMERLIGDGVTKPRLRGIIIFN